MKVDTMRKVDFYIGVPLCLLFTILLKPFLKRPKLGVVKKALWIELSEMGSSILVDPAMRALARRSHAELFFLIFKKNAPSLALLNTIPKENVLVIRDQNLWTLAWDTLRVLIQIRRIGIDSVIDLELFSRFTALLTGLSGAHNRVGFHRFHQEGLYRGELLTHRVGYNPHIHISKNFLALADALLSPKIEVPFSKNPISDEEARLARAQPTPEQQERVRSVIRASGALSPRDLILINPNASDMLPHRRWELSNYARVIEKTLKASPSATVLITGSKSERPFVEGLKDKLKDSPLYSRVVNFAGALDLQELPALYSISKLMITNDSGAAHFASVTDLPTFVLFGPETPRLYGSLGNFHPITLNLPCSPCVSAWNHRKTACTDNLCMSGITPELVFKRIEPFLTPAQPNSVPVQRFQNQGIKNE